MWFSHKGNPLRWHLPIGLLYDLHTTSSPSQLPWHLEAHLSPSPSSLLPSSREAVESVFMSSLKESDQLKSGGKVMKQMQKKEHAQLWLGLASDKFDQFWAINRRLMEAEFRHLPVRVYTSTSSSSTPTPTSPTLLQPLVGPGTPDAPTTVATLLEHLGMEGGDLLVQGVRPSPDTPLAWMARHLAYPDNFLHVVVSQPRPAS